MSNTDSTATGSPDLASVDDNLITLNLCERLDTLAAFVLKPVRRACRLRKPQRGKRCSLTGQKWGKESFLLLIIPTGALFSMWSSNNGSK